MSLTVRLPDELAGRLAAEADRRGLTVDDLLDALAEDRLPITGEGGGSLEAFIGCGASGQREPFDIHAGRAELAGRKLAEDA